VTERLVPVYEDRVSEPLLHAVPDPGLLPAPGPGPEERELVERARAGDHDAYAALMREHEQAAFRVAYVIVGSAADAEDVAQEAFVKAYRTLGRFRMGSPFRPWLLRIVGNEARNHRRASGRRVFHQHRAQLLEPVADHTEPAEAVLAGESRNELFVALGALREASATPLSPAIS
jgi:RNA polymerase sigma-70 factor (ECF subfamily)